MIGLVLFLSITLATASNYDIYCGFHFEPEPRVNVWACHPSVLSIVANDTITFHQLRSTSMPVFTNKYLPVVMDREFKDSAVNPHCIFGTFPNCGDLAPDAPCKPVPGSIGPDYPTRLGVPTNNCTEICIEDPNFIYSSGPLNDHLPITDFYTVRNPTAAPPGGPTWTARFPNPGVFPWFSCIDAMQGVVTVVPQSEAGTIPTPAEVQNQTDIYHAALPGLMQHFMDDNQVGSAYNAAPSYENDEGFTTWVLRAGWQDPETNITFSGFAPPNISVVQGDTIAFRFQWYYTATDDPYDVPAVHTVYFNASKDDPNWQAQFTYGGKATVAFGPQILFYPFFERFTWLGLWESSEGAIDGFGNPKHYDDGLLSSGFRIGLSKTLDDPSNDYNVVFTSAGTFPYICYLHLGMGMVGEITVTPREVADRTDSQVDATLANLDINMFKAYSLTFLGLRNGYFVTRGVSYEVSTATHGISELVFGDNNYMLQIKVAAVFRSPAKQSSAAQQTILNEVGESYTNFFAEYTFTPVTVWSYVAVASPYVDPNSENTTDSFFAGNIIVFHSDSQILTSSLLLFVSSVIMFLF